AGPVFSPCSESTPLTPTPPTLGRSTARPRPRQPMRRSRPRGPRPSPRDSEAAGSPRSRESPPAEPGPVVGFAIRRLLLRPRPQHHLRPLALHVQVEQLRPDGARHPLEQAVAPPADELLVRPARHEVDDLAEQGLEGPPPAVQFHNLEAGVLGQLAQF